LLTHPPTTHTYTLSLHDALPIYHAASTRCFAGSSQPGASGGPRHQHRRGCHLLGARRRCAPSSDGITTPPNPYNETVTHLRRGRSEEHTSELQSRGHLVCRLLLE